MIGYIHTNINVIKATFLDENKQVYHSFNDKPAVYYKSGAMEWYNEGILHRDNDKPALVYKDKTKMWYHKGILTRINGPSIIWYGSKFLKTYCIDGKLINPYSKNRIIDYPIKDEDKMEYFNKEIFIIKNNIPYIFNEYVLNFDKHFYNKYKILLT